MTCPVHGSHHHPVFAARMESARPPNEEQIAQQGSQQVANELEPIHTGILTMLTAGAGLAGAVMPLTPLPTVRRFISRVFMQRDEELLSAIRSTAYNGADAGRETAVSRYDLDVPTVIADGGVAAADRTNDVRREIDTGTRDAWQAVIARMTADIADSVYQANQEGMSRDEIASELEDQVFPAMRGWESDRISRTETYSGTSVGSYSALDESPRVDDKTWITRLDPKVRDTHRPKHGETIPMSDTWDVGGFPARWPGDYRLPIRERIQCRCVSVPGGYR